MKLSVIIPTYNEESTIHKTLEDLVTRHQAEEILVVDGGSTDNTVALAGAWATVIQSEKGRAQQMNAGARRARGEILLFLHADTRLPQRGLVLIKEEIQKGAKAGRFRMQFDRRDWLLRVFESYTRFQFFSYGDQGFFVRRNLFQELGGFRVDVPFEDIDFYRRLREQTQPVIIKNPVVTSARRFYSVGCLKQKFVNLFLVGLYHAKFDVFSLKRKWYGDVR